MALLTEAQAIDLCEAFGFNVTTYGSSSYPKYTVLDVDYHEVVLGLNKDQFTSTTVLASYLHSHVFNQGIERGKAHLRQSINELLNPPT